MYRVLQLSCYYTTYQIPVANVIVSLIPVVAFVFHCSVLLSASQLSLLCVLSFSWLHFLLDLIVLVITYNNGDNEKSSFKNKTKCK